MSTKVLYHLFGIRGYEFCELDCCEGRAVFTLEQPRQHYRCSECGSPAVHSQGHQDRLLQTVPIGLKPTFIFLKVARVICFQCEHTRQVKVPFADPRRTYTHSFKRYALELSKATTIQDAALHLQVRWDIIKDIQKRNLHRRFGRPKLKNLKEIAIDEIAIDEIAIGKGHTYFTVVLDLRSGAVVYVGDGKGADALTAFWKRLRASHAKIQAVATDMSKAYIAAVRKHLPKAVHVFDHFHVIKLYNEKLSAFRRELFRELTDEGQRLILKGTRYLLLKNPENLDPLRNEKQRLQDALDLNTPLTIAYYFKEDLRQIWQQPNQAAARKVLADWLRRAEESGVPMVAQFARTLADHRDGILAYYDYRISTGPLEGVNNKIKTLNRQAYGFRDRAFFKLRILALHQTKYALVG